jgi:hypothetical protein
MEGRDTTQETKDPLVRIAEALEKLARDPEVEIEVGPPVCPACGKLNPTVRVPDQAGGQGPMSEILVSGVCMECGSPLYVVIESYSVHQSPTTAAAEIEARTKAGLFSVEDQ